MKKLIILLFAAIGSTTIFATTVPKVEPDGLAKIERIFHHDFPEVNNSSITKAGNFYIVSFKKEANQSLCKVFYDKNGNTVQTIRYYEGDKLAPFIRSKIRSKYEGKSIFMVTEVASENEHYYEVMLQDAQSLWVVHAIDDGTMYIQKKFKRNS
ncbi:MAG: hypothetical protein ABI366_04305 [Ginsengibacter sp.]